MFENLASLIQEISPRRPAELPFCLAATLLGVKLDAKTQHRSWLHNRLACSSRPALACLLCIIAIGLTNVASGQVRDGFESGVPRLQLWQSDASAVVASQQMVTIMPHTGQTSEAIEINAGQGTYIHVIYPIRPAALIPELTGEVFMRAATSGLRVGFRVVLPESMHPATGSATTLVVMGDANTGAGKWSQVRIVDVVPKFEAALRIASSQRGYTLDPANAYVDAVVLDMYNGPGSTRLQIDDLAVDGLVDATRLANNALANRQLPNGSTGAMAAIDIPTQVQRIQRSVPRWVQYRDEGPEWLASLGINGLLVDADYDSSLIDRARQSNLKLIAPPPTNSAAAATIADGQTISSWYLSAAAAYADLDRTQQATVATGSLPDRLAHPRFVEAMEAYSLYSRMAEIVALPIPLPAAINSRKQADEILASQLTQLNGRSLPIASIVMEPSSYWTIQSDLARQQFLQVGSFTPDTAVSVDLLQARLNVARCVGLGMKGFLFRSTNPLDSGRQLDMSRANAMQALNAEIELLRPWIENGQPPQSVRNLNNDLFSGVSIGTDRSSLIILATNGSFDPIAAVSPNESKLEFILPRKNTGERAYRISHGSMESIALSTRPEGWGISIADPSIIEYIVMTSDPAAAGYLQNATARYAQATMTNRLEIAGQYLTLVQATLHNEGIAANDDRWRSVRQAEAALRTASSYQARGDLSRAIKSCETSIIASLQEVRSSWMRAVADFEDPRSASLLCNALGLPEHWQLHRLTQRRRWETHVVPGGELNDLQQLIATGWTHDQRRTDRIEHHFQIVSGVGEDGSAAMQISARGLQGEIIPGGFAGSTMRVRTPELPTVEARLVRLAGRVRIDRASNQPQAGLLVYDSAGDELSGSALGVPIEANGVKVGSWQTFELFRLAVPGRPMRLCMELRGDVAATIDAITMDSIVINPGSNFSTQFVSQPQ